MRPTVIARRLRPKTISTTRPPNWATPFSEATHTAAAVARPAASSNGTSCTEMTPNTNPFSDMMRAKSAMAIERARPSSGGPPVTRARPCGPRALGGLTPGETEPVQRQAHHQIDEGEHDEGLPPADLLVQGMADHPEHRRGERSEQREIGDRLPPARRRDLHQRGERGVVQAQPHAEAEERPHRPGRRPRCGRATARTGPRRRARCRASSPRARRAGRWPGPRRSTRRPSTSKATVKPRNTKPRLQPVSWLIGPARTPRQ